MPSRIPSNIERMYKEIGELDSAIQDLYNRLTPALGPTPPVEASKESQEVAMSPLADTLFRLNATLSQLTIKVRYISVAVEL